MLGDEQGRCPQDDAAPENLARTLSPGLLQGLAVVGIVSLLAFHFLQSGDPAGWTERIGLAALLLAYILGVRFLPWLRARALGALQLLCCLLALWMVANSVRLGFIGDGVLALLAGIVAVSMVFRDARRLIAYWLFATASVGVGLQLSARPPEVTTGTLVVSMLVLAVVSWVSLRAQETMNRRLQAANRVLTERNEELRGASREIKTLRGILPICASCKKIRDDKGYWNKTEAYIREHSDAVFSHSVCPECARKLYPDYADQMHPDAPEAPEPP